MRPRYQRPPICPAASSTNPSSTRPTHRYGRHTWTNAAEVAALRRPIPRHEVEVRMTGRLFPASYSALLPNLALWNLHAAARIYLVT
jgi:hypothetical protein